MFNKNKNLYVANWILLTTLLVAIMIIVGGLTRLTDSGLSITKWELFTGIIPPITLGQWIDAFNEYKKIPEFKIQNFSMSLNEFKVIYWWEYIHRLLGRIIGIVFILPLIFFTIKKYINFKDLIQLYLIFLLICFQGFIGWYMVKSGLTENIDVSHYRLSLHLTIAFIIFSLLFWNYLKFKYTNTQIVEKKLPFKIEFIFIFFLIIQISLGALVSGLDAGQIYQTWPLMGQEYYPNDSEYSDLFKFSLFESPSLLQFLHRNIAYFIFILFSIIATIVFRDNQLYIFRGNILLIFLFLLIQIFLGVFTVLSGAHIVIASLHQIGSIFLISSVVFLIFKNSTVNLQL